jgi:hypothetical protein
MIFDVAKLRYGVIVSIYLSLACMPWEASGRSELDKLCEKFTGFNQNNDNQVEIASLRLVVPSQRTTGPLVLMLVESRLLEKRSEAAELHPYLTRWAKDLEGEGCRAEVVAVTLATSKNHQDGRFILALREFLKAVQSQTRLAGVVLVGHFPDASIVRTTYWNKNGDVVLHRKSKQPQNYKDTRFAERKPSLVAAKADIVLADLKGNWDKVYIQQETSLPTLVAVFEQKPTPEGGLSIDVEEGFKSFEDVFHVVDGTAKVTKRPATRDGRTPGMVTLDDSIKNLECSAEEAKLPNGMAIPDIAVSRIDARGIALSPRSDLVGSNGARLLDRSGVPQTVKFPSKKAVPNWSNDIWRLDEQLERKLLAEYFDRNHNYRKGSAEVAWRPSSIAYKLGSGYRVMLRASDKWDSSDKSLRDLRGDITLVDFINWLEYPAVLRTVRAHSFPLGSQFHKADYKEIEKRVDGPIWSWTQRGDKLVPSLAAASSGGMLNWFLLRTLYENGRVASSPCFYHHTGCNSISPPGVKNYAYNHPRYSERQNAEALLFFGNGLALVGRAKVYFDEPAGFAEELGAGRTFGQAWLKYYRHDSQLPKIHNVSRKKAYFWSLLGDWTLRLKTPQAMPSTTLTKSS